MFEAKMAMRLALVCLVALIGGMLLWMARAALYPFAIALFAAYLINPVVCLLEARGLPRLWAIVTAYLVIFGLLAWLGVNVLPLMVQELERFRADLPMIAQRVEEILTSLEWQYQNSSIPAAVRIAIDNALLTTQRDLQEIIAAIVSGVVALVTHAIGILISPVLAFYLLYDWYGIKREMLSLAPVRWRRDLLLVLEDMDRVLNGVIRGQLLVALIVGTCISVGLYLLGIRYALLIGILAGLLDIIPYFGAFIGAAPAVALALLESPTLALKVSVLFLAVHQLEGTIIGPKILGESVGLHPLSVILFLFVGEQLGGLGGMLAGVPMAALAKVLLKHLARLLA